MADLLPDGFIWTPFCPDLDRAIFMETETLFGTCSNVLIYGSVAKAGMPSRY